MGPVITLYILGGCVALAALLFIIMIVLSVARPPKLPVLSMHSQPLQRMMRALTPLPFATGTFDEAPTTARTLPPRPPPIPTNVQARSASPVAAKAPSAAQPMPAAPAAPPAFAPSPFQWTAAPSHAPSVEAQPTPRDPRRAVSRPIYPVRRSRKLLWFVLTLFFTTGIAVAAVVAYPPMLDPMCDDYEWFGADAARDLRQRAHDTHAAIADFISTL